MKTSSKPYSEACERNRNPIVEILKRVFTQPALILEIGSGTGQHAIYFGKHLPHITWQTSDVSAHHTGIQHWLNDANLPNVLPPLELDVQFSTWPIDEVDGVFAANVAHIMAWPEVEKMLMGIAKILKPHSLFCLYGPFKYNSKFTSESNARFDQMLRDQQQHMGIRNIEEITGILSKIGLHLIEDNAMPANNQLLVWQKREP